MAKKVKNLKNESMGDLDKRLQTLQLDLQVLRFKTQGSKSKNVKEAGSLRKDIARVLTAINNNKAVK